MKQGTCQENTGRHAKPGAVDSRKDRFIMDECIKQVKKNKSAASYLHQRTISEDACCIFFRHTIYFVHMQVQQTHPGGIQCGKAKAIWDLAYLHQAYQDGIVLNFFYDALQPLPVAELEIDGASVNPCLFSSVPVLQYQQVCLCLSGQGEDKQP